MVIDSYGHEARDKNSGHVVSRGIDLAEIKRVLSASRCGLEMVEDINICAALTDSSLGAFQKNPYILWFNDFSSIAYKANLSNGNSQSSGIDSVGTSLGRTCFPRNNVSIMPSDLSCARLLHFISAADFLLSFERSFGKIRDEKCGTISYFQQRQRL